MLRGPQISDIQEAATATNSHVLAIRDAEGLIVLRRGHRAGGPKVLGIKLRAPPCHACASSPVNFIFLNQALSNPIGNDYKSAVNSARDTGAMTVGTRPGRDASESCR